MSRVDENDLLNKLMNEIVSLHDMVDTCLNQVEHIFLKQRYEAKDPNEIAWRFTGTMLTKAKGNILSLLRRERCAIAGYSANKGVTLDALKLNDASGDKAWETKTLQKFIICFEQAKRFGY